MTIKEFIVPLILAFLITWAVQYYFFSGKRAAPAAGVTQSFVAPTGPQTVKPLNTEVDFVDTRRTVAEVLTTIETPQATLVFSTDGACLYSLDFKRKLGGKESIIPTVYPPTEEERENRCFLVGFPEMTPYFYQLANRTENDATVVLTYKAPYVGGEIIKTFTVYKKTFQIDLEINFTPPAETAKNTALRLFYPAPIMPELKRYEQISSVVGDEAGKIRKIARASINVNQGWLNPTIFGADSKYFLHVLFKDQNSFAQRAYYKLYNQLRMASILEGPTVTQPTTWKISFYFGPKELSALALVDTRLEQTLDYSGLLAPLAKLLLAFLIFLFGYLHNYGLAIIVLTILIRLIMMPITIRGEAAIKLQAETQKKLKYLKERYKEDPQRLAEEQAALMRTQGLSTLAGCLPLLLQFPIFIILQRVLSSSIELYKAPFFGWITDLSAVDPWYILPILTTLAMLLSMTATDARQRLFSVAMAVVFGAISTTFSAGLVLYIFVSTAFGVVQSFIQRKLRA